MYNMSIQWYLIGWNMHHSMEICSLLLSIMPFVPVTQYCEYIFSLVILSFLISLYLNPSTHSCRFVSMYDVMLYKESFNMLMVSTKISYNADKELQHSSLALQAELISLKWLITLKISTLWSTVATAIINTKKILL